MARGPWVKVRRAMDRYRYIDTVTYLDTSITVLRDG